MLFLSYLQDPVASFIMGHNGTHSLCYVPNWLLDASAHGEVKLTYFTSINTIIYLDIVWHSNNLHTTSTCKYLYNITYRLYVPSAFLCHATCGISNALSQQLLTWSDIYQETPCSVITRTHEDELHILRSRHIVRWCTCIPPEYFCKYIILSQEFALPFWIVQFSLNGFFWWQGINTKE